MLRLLSVLKDRLPIKPTNQFVKSQCSFLPLLNAFTFTLLFMIHQSLSPIKPTVTQSAAHINTTRLINSRPNETFDEKVLRARN